MNPFDKLIHWVFSTGDPNAKVKTQTLRIVLVCGFYKIIFKTESKFWDGEPRWMAITNDANTTLFPTFQDAKDYLNNLIKGYCFVADSEKKTPEGNCYYEITVISNSLTKSKK